MRLLFAAELDPLRELVVLIELVRDLLGHPIELRDELEVAGILDRESGDRGADALPAQRQEIPQLVALERAADLKVGIPVFRNAAALAHAEAAQFVRDVAGLQVR